MKKYAFLGIMSALVLAGCGTGAGNQATEAVKDTTAATEQSVEIEETTEAFEASTDAAQSGEDISGTEVEHPIPYKPLNVELFAKYEGEWDDQGAIITADSATIHVLDDGYEALKETLNVYNEKNWQEVYNIYNEHLEYVTEGMFPEEMELYISREIEVTRSDEKVLSFVNAETSFMGGAHGSYYENAEVFDAATGEALELADVVTDYDKVYKYVTSSLKENYEAEMFFEGYEEWVEEMFYEPDGAMSSPLEWNMDMDGIQFRFNPYVIGPWASGMFAVELPYEGNEELFSAEYLPRVSGGRIRKLQPEEKFEIDGDRDGYAETIYYTVSDVREDFHTTLELHMSEERETGETSKTWSEDYYGTFEDVYLVEDHDPYSEDAPSFYYLYVEFMAENDYRRLYVIDLNENISGKRRQFDQIGDTDASIYEHFVVDADQFALFSRIYTLGTYSGFKMYSVGDNGMPVTEDKMYTLLNEGMEWEHTLTSKRELTVQMHVDRSEETVEEKLPKGTVFMPRKTDGETVMVMELEDGRRCDLILERKEGDHQFYINGVSEYDCFEDLPYAG